MSAADLRAFLAGVRRFLPPDAIIEDAERLSVYESDAYIARAERPGLVVLPRGKDEVCRIMRASDEFGVPVVARGAGTGLSGGAMPHGAGVLLSLARLNRILHVDRRNLTAVVQPGVTNLAISEAVSGDGLYYAPDPSSQLACSIGGNVAENSGGVHCLKYGLTVHNVRKLEVVTAGGDLVTIGSDALDAAGFDLLALMMGSEGMLGIVVEVTVELLPSPRSTRLAMAAFDAVQHAGDAVGDIIASGIIPAGLEMMDRPAIHAVEEFVHAGYPLDAEAILLCELDGDEESVASELAKVQDVLAKNGASEIRVAADEVERAKLWQGRKSAFPAVGRLSPDYFCMDGTIPRRRLTAVLTAIAELAAAEDLAVANVFHAGDGNLHPLILYDASREGELERAEKLGAAILELCVDVGGTITGEHGVGVEKIDQMCAQFSDAEVAQFHRLKAAFDPRALLNPGKAVPTLARCQEYRLLRDAR